VNVVHMYLFIVEEFFHISIKALSKVHRFYCICRWIWVFIVQQI